MSRDAQPGQRLRCIDCGAEYSYDPERDGYLCAEPEDCPACSCVCPKCDTPATTETP